MLKGIWNERKKEVAHMGTRKREKELERKEAGSRYSVLAITSPLVIGDEALLLLLLLAQSLRLLLGAITTIMITLRVA